MSVRDRVLRVARSLAAKRPIGEITVADVARAAKVSWPTANRHLGGGKGLDALLARLPAPKRDTRGRLLAAAARCIARDGYLATSLDAVALEAGLTKGAVYWHFDTRRDLLLALVREPAPLEPGVLAELLAECRDGEVRAGLLARHREAARRFVAQHQLALDDELAAVILAGLEVYRRLLDADPRALERSLLERIKNR